MSDLTELDELQSGLTSGFWARLQAHAEQEWGMAGATYQQALQRALSGPVGSEAEAVQRLKSVAFAHQAIRQLLSWPAHRVEQLKHAGGNPVGPSRRGPGL